MYSEAHGLCKEQIAMYKYETQLASQKSELKPFQWWKRETNKRSKSDINKNKTDS